jgi:hypothetical protein
MSADELPVDAMNAALPPIFIDELKKIYIGKAPLTTYGQLQGILSIDH